jgi:hypothetical protein
MESSSAEIRILMTSRGREALVRLAFLRSCSPSSNPSHPADPTLVLDPSRQRVHLAPPSASLGLTRCSSASSSVLLFQPCSPQVTILFLLPLSLYHAFSLLCLTPKGFASLNTTSSIAKDLFMPGLALALRRSVGREASRIKNK